MTHILLTTLILFSAILHSSTSLAENDLPAEDRLKSCEPRIALRAAKEILNDPKTLKEPLTMFSPAATLFQNGEKEEAVFWFYAAQLRTRYQLVFEKGDRGQLLSVMLMTVGQPINNYAFQDVERLDKTIDRVLLWDKATPNPHRERARTKEGEAEIEKVYSGIYDLRRKLIAEKQELERKAKTAAPQIEQAFTYSRTARCRPGEPDPALARRTIELEKKAVTEFAMSHRDVLREAGAIKSADVATYTQKRGSELPTRYTISVAGASKTIYAEINVSRSTNGTSFTLACTTSLWIGQRDPFKDVCAK